MKPRKRRRTDNQIANDIIRNTLSMKKNKIVPTKIQIASNLAYGVFKKHHDKMIKQKLIHKNTLLPTKKGILFHKEVEKILRIESKLKKIYVS